MDVVVVSFLPSALQPMGGNSSRKGGGELMFQACILQGALQQVAAAAGSTAPNPNAAPFAMPSFGNQPAGGGPNAASGLNLPLQQASGPSAQQAPMGVAHGQPSGSKGSQFNPSQQQPQAGSPLNTPVSRSVLYYEHGFLFLVSFLNVASVLLNMCIFILLNSWSNPTFSHLCLISKY